MTILYISFDTLTHSSSCAQGAGRPTCVLCVTGHLFDKPPASDHTHGYYHLLLRYLVEMMLILKLDLETQGTLNYGATTNDIVL